MAILFICVFNNAINAQVVVQDSTDTIKTEHKDTLISNADRKSKQAIESKITYSAKDSIIFLTKDRLIKLYGNVVIEYQHITLTAAYVEINFETKLLRATWVKDSSDKVIGKPVFKEKDKSFEADLIMYNFNTKKGYLTNIFTEESEAYVHGKEIKKQEDDVILVKNGSFTTCSEHDPHFEICFTKAKIIPDDKIITGPVWLSVEKVPLPLALPFGYFPNSKGKQSGIIIPTYGERANRGFFLENGGYYFGINDYVDVSILGDIYSRGSWALKTNSNYKKRYKYDGHLNVSYAVNKLGEPETPDFFKQKDFFIVWKHNQDRKAHPRHIFNADVKAGSSEYNKYNPSSANDYLSSTFSSSVSFSTTIKNNINFSANIRHDQNKQTHQVNLNLPELSLSINRFFPFRRKNISGKLKWYENINMNYVMNAKNTISKVDSLFFQSWEWKDFSNGFKHQIPISWSQKIFKHFNLTTSFSYNERWYFQTLDKHWDNNELALITDTIQGFKANRDFEFSTQITSKLYGMFQFFKGPVTAVRHVLTPNISFRYRPDFGQAKWKYYKYYNIPGDEAPTYYSVFQNGIYGYSPFGESGALQLSLSNNLEMKVKSKKDTIGDGVKKIVLIENLNISTSYDIAKDSLNWSKLVLNGRTRLFNNINISYFTTFDPYIIDSVGKNLNQFEWNVNKKLLRQTRSDWGTSLNWQLNNSTLTNLLYPTKTSGKTTKENKQTHAIPWNMTLAYNLQYGKSYEDYVNQINKMSIIQTISITGDVKLTPNWKIGLMTNYDIKNKDFTYTSLNVYRDLHCWEIVFNWIPTGFRKSYNFTLRVKASALQDLKIEKKTDFRDYY